MKQFQEQCGHVVECAVLSPVSCSLATARSAEDSGRYNGLRDPVQPEEEIDSVTQKVPEKEEQ